MLSVALHDLPAAQAARVAALLRRADLEPTAPPAPLATPVLAWANDSAQATQRLAQAAPGSAWVMLLSSTPGPAPVAPALRGLAWLSDRCSDATLLAALHAADAGLIVSQRLGFIAPELPGLTAREVEVFELMSRGLSNREIGALLGISAHTAKFHVGQILDKTGAATRAEAVRAGVRQGLIGV